MAAAVSAASTLRLLSCRTDLSGRSALAAGVGLLGGGTGAGAWIVGPLKATGFANTDGEDVTETGASGTFWNCLHAPDSHLLATEPPDFSLED
jgi:hypothetical protein